MPSIEMNIEQKYSVSIFGIW